MKKSIFILILLNHVFAYSQFERIFERNYKDGYKPLFQSKIHILNDNSILIIATPEYHKDGFKILNISQEGQLNWEYETQTNQLLNIYGLFQNENQDIRLIGKRIRDTSGWSASLFFVCDIDLNGNPIKEKTYTLTDSVAFFFNNNNQIYTNNNKIVVSKSIQTTGDDGYQIFQCDNIDFNCHDKLDEYITEYFFNNSLNKNSNGKFVNNINHGYKDGVKYVLYPQINILDNNFKPKKIYFYYGYLLDYANFYIDDLNNFISIYHEENSSSSFIYSVANNDTLRKKPLKNFASLFLTGKLSTNKYFIYGHTKNFVDKCRSLNVLVADENLNIIADTILSSCVSNNYYSDAKVLDNERVFLVGYKDDKMFWEIIKYKTLSVENQVESKPIWWVSNPYPNPYTNVITLDYAYDMMYSQKDFKFTLYNVLGVKIADLVPDFSLSNGNQGKVSLNIPYSNQLFYLHINFKGTNKVYPIFGISN